MKKEPKTEDNTRYKLNVIQEILKEAIRKPKDSPHRDI